jgi:rhodanese-related sulfurtransferase
MSTTITLQELRDAIAARELTVIETLGPMYYAAGHLPGAINIPHTAVGELAPELLPARDAPIVTYCSNEACANSTIAQNQLIALGYTNVRKFPGGKQEWESADLPLETTVAI